MGEEGPRPSTGTSSDIVKYIFSVVSCYENGKSFHLLEYEFLFLYQRPPLLVGTNDRNVISIRHVHSMDKGSDEQGPTV